MALYFILRGVHEARSETLGVKVPRAALRVRFPRAHVRKVATPSDVIELNSGVRIPWTA